jgi:hypothetical protein
MYIGIYDQRGSSKFGSLFCEAIKATEASYMVRPALGYIVVYNDA